MIEEGKKAPDFALPNSEGKVVHLKDLMGKSVVLYFYPKDDTPGCTKESCDFRDNIARVTRAGAIVLGMSADSIASHKKFRTKYGLPFELLSDEGKEVLQAYGVWQPKKLYGKSFLGIVRTTVIIDEEGIVRKIYPKVSVEGHVDEVLAELASMKKETAR